jgi:hypothetical protein
MASAEQARPEAWARHEERIAGAEHAVEKRLHSLAEHLPDADDVHERADSLSQQAERHRDHAQALRARGDAEESAEA